MYMYTLVAAIFECMGKQELHMKGSVFAAYVSLQVIVNEGMLSVSTLSLFNTTNLFTTIHVFSTLAMSVTKEKKKESTDSKHSHPNKT